VNRRARSKSAANFNGDMGWTFGGLSNFARLSIGIRAPINGARVSPAPTAHDRVRTTKAARELRPGGVWDELPAFSGSIHPL
jgi:hypothetical protein